MLKKAREMLHALIIDYRDHTYPYTIGTGFFNAVLVIGFIYRSRIYMMLTRDTAFVVSQGPSFLFWKGLFNEIVFALFLGLLMFIPLRLVSNRIPFNAKKGLRILVAGIAVCIVVFIAMVYNSSYHFWVSMNTGLTRDLILEGIATTKIGEALKFINPLDIIIIILAIVAMFAYIISGTVEFWRNRIAAVITPCVVLVFVVHSLFTGATVAGGMSEPPLLYTAVSFFEKENWRNANRNMQSDVNAGQMQSVQLIDPRFVFTGQAGRNGLRYGFSNDWNFLYIVLESTGREYVFDTSKGNPMPMPFLHELSQKSLVLDYHFGTGNTSPRSLFSILSGLYPSPRVQMFCTKQDVTIPSIATFLGPEYDSFLVSPGSLDWFFPHGFMKNSGFKELYGYENVPARVTRDKYGKDEIETVSFFLERLKQSAGKPFLAVYYSFIAHWPYVDFGEQYRIFPNTENRLCRYYNNLYLMDTQIKRIYEFLEQAGILGKTIIIIVGDHGEAFNQHNGNWVHSRASYNENYMVPALIYQPRIFTPRRITVATTHADILPTLLDATGIQYNEKLIQGESLLSGKLKRKYVFLFGNENTISSISMNKIKLQYSFKDNRGWAFDLNRDPRENNPLPFEEYNEQREAMMYYYEYQDHVLAAYNESLKSGNAFYGQKHSFRRR